MGEPQPHTRAALGRAVSCQEVGALGFRVSNRQGGLTAWPRCPQCECWVEQILFPMRTNTSETFQSKFWSSGQSRSTSIHPGPPLSNGERGTWPSFPPRGLTRLLLGAPVSYLLISLQASAGNPVSLDCLSRAHRKLRDLHSVRHLQCGSLTARP